MSIRPSRSTRSVRLAVAAALSVAVFAGCGAAPSGDPNTPAAGVNVDQGPVQLRGLVIVANAEGRGTLNGVVLSREDDTLTKISGAAHDATMTPAGALSVSESTIQVGANQPAAINRSRITVSSPDLKPGFTARLVFTFEKAGDVQVTVPVLDSEHPDFQTTGN
ncbi:hypothetical protein [Aestuariimicrobium ganziense]|uniref:hypothetical protein n=1 Tax=Aestuariimicrobium ganziense TaxID=2773677 RepID=UPI001942BA39|nr:hypothetical protein [Aestuariimicrobium ganziense]